MSYRYHTIYKTTCLIDGKYYYGVHSTNNLEDGYLGSGKHLKRAIAKYGKDAFHKEILYVVDSREEAFIIENKIVNEDLVKDGSCYNIQLGGRQAGHTGNIARVTGSNLLVGDNRTKNQKDASRKHAVRMKGRKAWNRKQISLFDRSFDTVTEAIKYFGLSTSQYYYMRNCNIVFSSPEELKNHIWRERSKKLSKSMGG